MGSRIQAISVGARTYQGSTCKKCGGVEKYTSNYGCVGCSRSKDKSEYNKVYWARLKETGGHTKYSDTQRRARKAYYDTNKTSLASRLHEQKEELGEFYVTAALNHIRCKSRRHNIPFTISADDIVIPTHCPILGIELQHNVGGARDNSPSIDRIRPELGYVPGNVVVISSRANRIKNNATIDEMYKIWSFYAERF